jgi:hypothetical protein
MNLVLELREKVPAREGKGFEENTLTRVCKGVKDSDWNEKIVGLIETTFVRKVASQIKALMLQPGHKLLKLP